MASGKRPLQLLELEAAEALVWLNSGEWITPQHAHSDQEEQPAVAVGVGSCKPSSSSCTQKKSYQSPINPPPPSPPVINKNKNKRPKLTQAEKEERKGLRIMSNRESARRTIRRRQAEEEELTEKVDDLEQENKSLKKDVELILKRYNSLKGTNIFHKALLDKVRKDTAAAEEEGPRIIYHSFWPPCTTNLPSSSHSQFPIMPPYSSHQHLMANTRSAVPWFLPAAPPHSNYSCSHDDDDDDNIHPPGHIVVPGLFTPVRDAPEEEEDRTPHSNYSCSHNDDDNIHPPGHIVVPGLFTPVRDAPEEEDRTPHSNYSCSHDDDDNIHPPGHIVVPGLFTPVRDAPEEEDRTSQQKESRVCYYQQEEAGAHQTKDPR